MNIDPSSYRIMLLNSGHYTLREMEFWSEEDCEAEYQEITIGGET